MSMHPPEKTQISISPPRPEGLLTLSGGFDAIVCDLWGVVHNGLHALPDAVDCLVALRQKGKFVVLLSNAPRPAKSVAAQIRKLGVPTSAFDGIVTSGELARSHLKKQFRDGRYFHLGPPRDTDTISDLPLVALPSPEGADVVICTGLVEGNDDDIEAHLDLLREIAQRRIPFICANPDRVVHVGRREVLCSGALAHRLESLGGEVIWFGKPFANAYAAAEAMLSRISGRQIPKSKILAIGDSMETDIQGARRAGLRSLLIADGIHRAELTDDSNESSVQSGVADANRFLEQFGFVPDGIMSTLRA